MRNPAAYGLERQTPQSTHRRNKMGRPLPSRFFGNRNTGSASVTTDDGIGGGFVASAAVSGGAYTTRPVFTFTAPELPNGVTATATVTSEASTGAVTTAGTGYNVGDLLTLTAADGGTATAYVATLVGGAGTGIATVNFTGTGASRGSFQALPGAKFATGGTAPNTVSATGTGSGAEITVTFRAKATVITEPGSGYTAAPTAATGPSQSVSLGTVTMSTPSGTSYGADAFATIKVTAQTTAGGSALAGDIVAQKGSRRYRVVTTDGTAVCNLVASSPAVNQMSLIATDYSGNTYYVTKLTRHRVLLTQLTGSSHEFATSSSAAWTLDALVADDTGITVQLANS